MKLSRCIKIGRFGALLHCVFRVGHCTIFLNLTLEHKEGLGFKVSGFNKKEVHIKISYNHTAD
jgi:hypothetical protein